MISRHIHRNPGVGCGTRLLKELLAIRLSYQKTIAKSLVIAVLSVLEKLLANPLSRKIRGKWLVMSSSPRPCRLGLVSTAP